MNYYKFKFVSTPFGVQEREKQGTSQTWMKEILFGRRMLESQSLYKRDLLGHFGCVNAIEFSTDGEFIASGGDDRRLLVWNIHQTIFSEKPPDVIDTLHISNINSCCFDADNRKISTGGNDGQVIVHDFSVKQSTAVYGLSDAVYCLSPDPVNAMIMATASDDGRAQILDTRMPIDTSPFVLADLGSAMHSVMYNPAEPRLLATANSKYGVGIWDIRMPHKCINYKNSVQNCMSVRFNSRGDQLLALRRRSSPVLYDIGKMHPLYEFDYKTYYNACTLKSCAFAGQKDEFVMSGSDDFCVYLWKIPTDISENYIQSEPHMVLKGHRSIVNQVRYCPYNQTIISSGVEKLIKLWSPYYIPGCSGHLHHSRRYGDDDDVERNAYSHEEYIHMVLQAGSFLSHDYTNGTTEEEPCMIAFFDSLIQREVEQSIEGEEDSSSASDNFCNDGGGGGGEREGSSDLIDDSEATTNTRGTSGSLTRSLYVDLDSSSDSEGEVDVILSAMYRRYMSSREKTANCGSRPSKKISSVIARGKQRHSDSKRNEHFNNLRRVQDGLQLNVEPLLRDSDTNMSILADVIDTFVDNFVSQDSNNSRILSDTNDGQMTAASSSSSSSPVEMVQQTSDTANICSPHSSEPVPHSGAIQAAADSTHNILVLPAPLESGMYFLPELQAFVPDSFSAVVNLSQSADLTHSGGVTNVSARDVQNTSLSGLFNFSGSGAEVNDRSRSDESHRIKSDTFSSSCGVCQFNICPHADSSQRSGPRTDSSHRSGPHTDSSHRSGPRTDTSHRSGPRTDTSHRSGPRTDTSHRSGPRTDTSHRSGPRTDTSHRSGPRTDTSHRSGPRTDSSQKLGLRTGSSQKLGPCTDSSHRSSPRNNISHRSDPRTDSSHRSGPRTNSSHRSDPRTDSSHRSDPRTDSSRRSGPCTDSSHRSGPRTDNSWRSGPCNDNSRRSGPCNDNSRRSGPCNDNSRRSGPCTDNSQRSGPCTDSSQRSGPCTDSSQRSGPCTDSSQRPGPCTDSSQRSGPCTDSSQRSGPCTDSSQRSGPCNDSSQKSGPCTDSSQKSGPCNDSSQRSGPCNDNSWRSSPCTDSSQRSGPCNDSSQRSGPCNDSSQRSGPCNDNSQRSGPHTDISWRSRPRANSSQRSGSHTWDITQQNTCSPTCDIPHQHNTAISSYHCPQLQNISGSETINKHHIPVTSARGDKSDSLKRNPNCSPPASSVTSQSSSQSLLLASVAETLTTRDVEHETRETVTCIHTEDSHPPVTVRFKKAKVKGRNFRIHQSQSRSSSDEDN